MLVELSDRFPKFMDKILDAIRENPPIDDLKFTFLATSGKDIGMSFEPRILVNYRVSHNTPSHGKITEDYSTTFVFEKNYDFVTMVDSHWIKNL